MRRREAMTDIAPDAVESTKTWLKNMGFRLYWSRRQMTKRQGDIPQRCSIAINVSGYWPASC